MGGLQPKGVVAQNQTPRYFGMRDVNLGRRGFLAQEQLAERRRIRSGFCGSRRAGSRAGESLIPSAGGRPGGTIECV